MESINRLWDTLFEFLVIAHKVSCPTTGTAPSKSRPTKNLTYEFHIPPINRFVVYYQNNDVSPKPRITNLWYMNTMYHKSIPYPTIFFGYLAIPDIETKVIEIFAGVIVPVWWAVEMEMKTG
jgi:hypothetical protein